MKYDNQQKSFDEFQNSFIRFWTTNKCNKENEGFNNYEWRINDVQIVHYVFDRFGPEEHMKNKKAKIININSNRQLNLENKLEH
jgi:hypothetical protein